MENKNNFIGFFQKSPTSFICRYCGIEIRGWDGKKCLLDIHRETNQFCPMSIARMAVDESFRVSTFPKDWKFPDKNRMSKAGFVYTEKNTTMCVFCMSFFKDWEEKDEPFVVHLCSKNRDEVTPSAPPSEEKECFVCFNELRSVALIPCGHVPCCEKCSNFLNKECPVCKQPVERYLKLFF